MKLAIIGAGHVGSALGHGWAKAGHDVRYGTRAPAAPDHLTPSAAAAWGTVVVLALPWGAAEAVAANLGSLSGKIIIDCRNPIARTPEGIGLALGHNTSLVANRCRAGCPKPGL
ncbi:NAD(P)-binding domain-containing protein [Fontisubflavum oceani]|uniref:NAD(P)-binding domain-containing protein n=1 Tax=Fontisubflavum oceani TaxID=2978973 RepID=UPI0025B3EE1A|nr:NAD(P)-binding domain-containing protein [Fontisubflavum oceani]WJY20312.1 NAD(P)-binding domain-containing protein [Fontisubflavum oceani]